MPQQPDGQESRPCAYSKATEEALGQNHEILAIEKATGTAVWEALFRPPSRLNGERVLMRPRSAPLEDGE